MMSDIIPQKELFLISIINHLGLYFYPFILSYLSSRFIFLSYYYVCHIIIMRFRILSSYIYLSCYFILLRFIIFILLYHYQGLLFLSLCILCYQGLLFLSFYFILFYLITHKSRQFHTHHSRKTLICLLY